MDASKLVAKQTQQFNQMLNNQNKTQNQLFKSYEKQVKAQPSLTSVLSKAQQKRGVGGLQNSINLFQGQVGDVKGLIDRLDENTASRTEGTQATQAYLDRMRAVEGGALNTQLGRLGAGLQPVTQAYELASRDIEQLLTATQQDQAKRLQPAEMRINSLNDRFARQITGYTRNKENELNVLLDKIERQRELNDREWQKAQQLAAEARTYAREKQQVAQEQAYRRSLIERQLNSRTQSSNSTRPLPNISAPRVQSNSILSFNGGPGDSASAFNFDLQGSSPILFR